MKFASAVILALVGAVAAKKTHGQCGAGKHRHHTSTKAKTSSTTPSEIVKPTSSVVVSSSVAVTSSAVETASSSDVPLPTAIINVGPPAAHHSHSFSHSFSSPSPSSQSRSTVLVTSTVTASSVSSSEATSSSEVSSSALTSSAVHMSTSVVVPTSHSTTSSIVVPTTTKSTVTSSKPTTTSTVKPTTSSTVKPTTTSSSKAPIPTSGANAKRGVGFNNAADTLPFTGAVSWAYNWDSTYSGTLPPGVDYSPMLWGVTADHTTNWNAHASAAIAQGSQYLLGFNEPDLSTQSNIDPTDAATAWKKYMEPFADKAQLVSPAVTNGDPAQGFGTGWLDQFMAACTGCHVDVIAIHIYDSATNEAYFKSYISGVVKKYGLPVFVTEFGGSGSTAQQQTFLGDMVSYLDDLEGLARYAAFGDFQNTFVSGSELTPLGASYAHAS